MSERITILGAGSWGMAIARLLDMNGRDITLWAYDPREYYRLLQERGDPTKLPRLQLAPTIEVTNDLKNAIDDCDLVVLAVPAQHLRSVLRELGTRLRPRMGVVNLAKGIETGSLKRMSEVAHEETHLPIDRICTLSGPSHAEEVALDMPTTVVVAGTSDLVTSRVQEIFSNLVFRVYRSSDLTGVELGGSLKNVIAIAAGIVDGLGFGDNTKGALITRGLAEMTRLGMTLGAKPETFAGLSGLGDLVTTCCSRHSRNRWVGEQIGTGKKLHEILLTMSMVAEGVETTRSAYSLARHCGVEMPITSEVFRVLFDGKSPLEAIEQLMGRSLKAEVWRPGE